MQYYCNRERGYRRIAPGTHNCGFFLCSSDSRNGHPQHISFLGCLASIPLRTLGRRGRNGADLANVGKRYKGGVNPRSTFSSSTPFTPTTLLLNSDFDQSLHSTHSLTTHNPTSLQHNVQVHRCHFPRCGVDRLCCPRRGRLCRGRQAFFVRYWYLVRAGRQPR